MGLLPVIKADAYGHGAVVLARTLQQWEGVSFFAVATVNEALAIRAAGVEGKFLILGSLYEEDLASLGGGDMVPVVWQQDTAQRLAEYACREGFCLPVHVKVDTGMNRAGVPLSEALALITEIDRQPSLVLAGLMSHLAAADGSSVDAREYCHRQIALFLALVEEVLQLGINPHHIHLANSAALIRYPLAACTLCRPGIMLYGAYPAPDFSADLALEPVMSVVSAIVMLKTVAAGESVSYGCTFTARRPTRVALVPIGYADGLPRLLSNRGWVLVGGRRMPIIGRVCMDWTMVDVSDINDVKVGDEVVIIGRQGDERIAVEEVADWAATISYEVLCGWTSRLPRVYHQGSPGLL